MLGSVLRLADYFVPGAAPDVEPEMVRRVRAAVLLAWLMGAIFALTAATRLAAGELRLAAVVGGLSLTCFVTPHVVRWTGRFRLVANLVLAVVSLWLCYLGVSNPSPGLNAAAVALCQLPLLAILILGVRTGCAWSVGCAVAVLAIGVARFAEPLAPTFEERAAFSEYGAVLLASMMLVAVGLFYESGKDARPGRTHRLEVSRAAQPRISRSEVHANLPQAERFASMGRLAATLAHEINNPLACVIANLEHIKAALPDGDKDLAEVMAETAGGAERIRTIVAELHRLTCETEEGHPLIADITDAIQIAVDAAKTHTAAKAQVRLEVEPGLWVSANKSRIVQLVLHLIINAAEAIPDGRRSEHHIIVRAQSRHDEVLLEVEDNGPGIPDELIERVREPFFTTKPVGQTAGLGLAISESIVRKYGGRLDLEGAPGRTVVRVKLLGATELEALNLTPSAVRSIRTPASRRLRISICDDDILVARALRRHLRDHDVEIALGGRELLDRIGAGEHYDLILCDIMMPDVSGLDVYGAIKADHPHYVERLVFMSGGAFTESGQMFKEHLGDRPFLPKPISLPVLHELLRDAASARPTASAVGLGETER